MNDPATLQELIDRHFDGLNTPEEADALARLIETDPHAGAAMAEAARFEALLQEQLPLRRKKSGWKPRLLICASCAVAAAVAILFVPTILRNPGHGKRVTPADEEGMVWVPIETAVVPISIPARKARSEWDSMQRGGDNRFVSAPEVIIEERGKVSDGRMELLLRPQPSPNSKEAWASAAPCQIDANGTVDLGSGCRVDVEWISMAAFKPVGSSTEQNATSTQLTSALFDHKGRLLPAGTPSGRLGEEWLRDRNQTSLLLGLRLSHPSLIRIGLMEVFDSQSLSEVSFLRLYPINSPGGKGAAQELISTAWLCSDRPITFVIAAAIAESEPFILENNPGARAGNEAAEAQFLAAYPGNWKSSASVNNGNLFTLAKSSSAGLKEESSSADLKGRSAKASCTFCISVSRGFHADVSAITADGEVKSAAPDDEYWRLPRFHTFPVPLESVTQLKVQILSRKRIFFTLSPPFDPMNGLNKGVSDALEFRLPEKTPDVTLAVSAILGSEGSSGLDSDLSLGAKNATLREILIELGRKQGKRIEIDIETRRLRGVPLKE